MDNFELMRKRLEYQGGIDQESRMIKDKYKTFLKSLKYSYQGCDVQLVQHYDAPLKDGESIESEKVRALINPDKNKQDYDDKILSIDYKEHFGPGDVFRWINTDTCWIIYLEELTEDAYFRGEIRRCKYTIKFRDSDGVIYSTWAAIRGPVETQIESIQKNQIRVDRPNLSLNILIPKNEKTEAAFTRYKEFLFAGRCWRVQAYDTISIRNVIEINAEEYYIDRDTDDVENNIKDGLIIEPEQQPSEIQGPSSIKAKITNEYIAPDIDGVWSSECGNVDIEPFESSKKVRVTWNKMTGGHFVLQWAKDGQSYSKEIDVSSLM